MKKLIIVTMIAACVALCAAVWPHGNAVEETPVPAAETAVSAKEATVAEIEEPATLAEKEKRTIPQQEAPQEEQEVMEAVLAGKVDVVLISSLDRIGRDWGMTKQYIALLTEHKVKLLCLRERVSSDSSGVSPFST